MKVLNFFNAVKRVIDAHQVQLVSYAMDNADFELEETLVYHPLGSKSVEIVEFSQKIAEQILPILSAAKISFSVAKQTETPDIQRDLIHYAYNAQDIIDGILWVFSPINKMVLHERMIDGTLLIISQRIDDYINLKNDNTDIELVNNPYQAYLNYLLNQFNHGRNENKAFRVLEELIEKQSPLVVIKNSTFMFCPSCDIQLVFHHNVCPNYCHHCGQRLIPHLTISEDI